jgi:hypothetical protein
VNSAIFSPCGKYRYRLDRDVYPERATFPVYAFLGINGSTADGTSDDQTVRKWTGFCRLWGARSYIVGNAFGFKTTQVSALSGCVDPVGPRNDYHLAHIIADADIIVPCWGNRHKVPAQLRYRFDMLKRMIVVSGRPIKIFGLTKGGDPMHPLMLPYSTPLEDWKI